MVSVEFKRSTREGKKMMAIFYDDTGKKISTTHFGEEGASDYTRHKDPERKKRYIERHRKNEDWDDYKSPGSLSRFILWNEPTLEASIKAYVRRFNLKLRK